MHIVLFEDHITAENRPITLARPAFAVSMAGSTLHDIARDCGSSVGAVVRDYLQARTQKDFDLVETAVCERDPDIDHGKSRPRPLYHRVDDPLSHRRDVFPRDRATDYFVEEFESAAGIQRVQRKDHVRILPPPACLLHQLLVDFDRRGHGLPVCNLRPA